MRLEIRFRHMDRSEALETYTSERIEHALEGFNHRHDAHVQVWLISEVSRATHGSGQFNCEIEVRTPRQKDHFIQKSGTDMHVAIQDAVEKLKLVLDEAGKREQQLRNSGS